MIYTLLWSTQRIQDLLFAELREYPYSVLNGGVIQFSTDKVHYSALYYSELFPNDVICLECTEIRYEKRYGRNVAVEENTHYRYYKDGKWHPNDAEVFREEDLRYDRERMEKLYPDRRIDTDV